MRVNPKLQFRATKRLREENESAKLLSAATTSYRSEGQNDMASVLTDLVSSPSRPSKMWRLSGLAENMKEVPNKPVVLPTKITPTDGLSHLLHGNLTRKGYQETRRISKSDNTDIWPAYNDILAEKKECYPPGAIFTDFKASVTLGDRLRHNDNRLRILKAKKIKMLLQDIPEGGTLHLICENKAGFDGSTGHSQYNQNAADGSKVKDNSLLATCLCPLQYRRTSDEAVWTNPVPQGANFCQPLILSFEKETPEILKRLDTCFQAEMASLTPHRMYDEDSVSVFLGSGPGGADDLWIHTG